MGRRLGGWRVAARIARRDAGRSRGRTALVAALVGLPVLAGSALGTLLQSTYPTVARIVQTELGDAAQARVSAFYGTDVLQSPDAGQTMWQETPSSVPTVAEHEAALRAALPAGDTLARVVEGDVTLATPERAVRVPVAARELPADPALASLHDVVDGSLPTAPGEVALSERTARTLAVGPGDALEVHPVGGEPVDVVVRGLLRAGSWIDVVAAPGALFPAPTAAGSAGVGDVAWYVLGSEPVTWDHVQAVNGVGSTVVSRAVLLDPPSPADVPFAAYVEPATREVEVVAVGVGVGAIVLLEAVLLIGPAFAVGARRAERNLALLAAAGAERRTLRHVVLLSGTLTGAAASGAAALAGVAIAAVVRLVVRARGSLDTFPDLRVPWLALAGMVVLGVLIATAAAWLPSHRAGRLDVVAALAGRRAAPRLRRRVPVAGVALAAVGVAVALAGVAGGSTLGMVAGIGALELGVVATSGAVVALAARMAPRLGVAGRMALRDAARNRARTAPAVAAVVAAVGATVAAGMYLGAEQRAWAGQYAPAGPVGTVAVSFVGAADGPELRASSEAALDALPVVAVAPVTRLAPPPSPDGPDSPAVPDAEVPPPVPADEPPGPQEIVDVRLERPPGAPCSGPDGWADQECMRAGYWSHAVWSEYGPATLVDDGTVLAILGEPDAAAALADGLVVVTDPLDVWPDGTAHVVVTLYTAEGDVASERTTVLPAAVARLPVSAAPVVVPPSALEPLGLVSRTVGLAASTSRLPTEAEVAEATADLDLAASLYVERGPGSSPDSTALAMAVAALVVAVAACGIAVALATADARPDLATLAAVGASPSVRRRMAAAQAGVVAGIGAVVGLATGLALGAVLVMARGRAPDVGTWEVEVPWETVVAVGVGLPVLAVVGAWLCTRSRLPLVRRLAA